MGGGAAVHREPNHVLDRRSLRFPRRPGAARTRSIPRRCTAQGCLRVQSSCMRRRTFLQVSGVAPVALAADAPMPMTTLGKSGLKVSKFCLGGYHMRVNGEANAVKMIHRAIDLGVNFFDSAHHYNKG